MAKVCHSCGKGPAFGHSRSHSMVATKRRFNPNLQKVRILERARHPARVRLHPLPQGRQGHQGRLSRASPAWRDTNLARFRAVVAGALAHLEARRQEVNDLNVFPVADGDTGDNMALTLRAVLGELDRLVAEAGPHDRRDRPRGDRRRRRPRRAARRPRQQRRDPLASSSAARPRSSSRAPASSSTRRSSARRWPARSTAPTPRCATRPRARSSPSSREMAHRIATELAHMPDPRLEPDDAARRARTRAIADVLERALEAGQESVKRSARAAAGPARGRRRRRRRLRADGHLRRRRRRAARRRGARGRAPPRARARHAPRARARPTATARTSPSPARTSSRARSRARSRRSATRVLVVGDPHTLKVHVHTDDPEAAHGAVRRASARSRTSTSPTCTRRSPSARGAPGGDAPPGALRRARRRRGRGDARAVRVARRPHASTAAPTLNPSTLRAARRHPRRAGRGGRRPAELART